MSNYAYLRKLIEKIAEKGKVTKKDIPELMAYARVDSNRVKDVDNFVNGKIPNKTDIWNKETRKPYPNEDLKNFVKDEAFGRGEDSYLESLDPINGSSRSDVLPETHNKYGKYLKKRSRIREKESILNDLIKENTVDESELHFNNELRKYVPEMNKKRELYEALLQKLTKDPLYEERFNIETYI